MENYDIEERSYVPCKEAFSISILSLNPLADVDSRTNKFFFLTWFFISFSRLAAGQGQNKLKEMKRLSSFFGD